MQQSVETTIGQPSDSALSGQATGASAPVDATGARRRGRDKVLREDATPDADVTNEDAKADTSDADVPEDCTRDAVRVTVRCGCWLYSEDATVYGSTVNLGNRGVLMRTALRLPAGAEVQIHLQLPGAEETVVARGRVARRVQSKLGSRPALAVSFDDFVQGSDTLFSFLGSQLPPAAH